MATQSPAEAPTRRSRFRQWRRQRPLVGGILIALGGIEMFGSSQMDVGKLHIQLGIEGLQATVIPLVLLLLGALIIAMPVHRIFYGVIALAVALYSLIGVNLGGFLIGMLLSTVGGILAVSWMPPVPTADSRESSAAGETSTGGEPSVAVDPAEDGHTS
ncbi:MAG: DUF6114 domain-containing protein [Microbacterium sp.]|uniref:DUF6114 domain-containing protein n=1 Tax=Microbacterium sp. TaxID=51671 RepID=UPI0026302CA5|nr:DUF6114 domain-containing protein [Microbacterium sp.]MCX6503495.1 DUF6114 domain-containing protein [Microbacterium sp.]